MTWPMTVTVTPLGGQGFPTYVGSWSGLVQVVNTWSGLDKGSWRLVRGGPRWCTLGSGWSKWPAGVQAGPGEPRCSNCDMSWYVKCLIKKLSAK